MRGGIQLGQNLGSTFEIRFKVKEKNSDIWGKCFRKNHTVSQSSDGDSDVLNISAVHTVSQQYTEDRYTISPKPKIAYTSTTLSEETGAQWIRAMFLKVQWWDLRMISPILNWDHKRANNLHFIEDFVLREEANCIADNPNYPPFKENTIPLPHICFQISFLCSCFPNLFSHFSKKEFVFLFNMWRAH